MIRETSLKTASLKSLFHDVINTLYYEYWPDKRKHFKVFFLWVSFVRQFSTLVPHSSPLQTVWTLNFFWSKIQKTIFHTFLTSLLSSSNGLNSKYFLIQNSKVLRNIVTWVNCYWFQCYPIDIFSIISSYTSVMTFHALFKTVVNTEVGLFFW